MSLSHSLCYLGYFLFSLSQRTVSTFHVFKEREVRYLVGKLEEQLSLLESVTRSREMMFLPEEAQCHQEGITQTGAGECS